VNVSRVADPMCYFTDLQSPRQITVNDLPVGRSVDETIRLITAFQFAVRLHPFALFLFLFLIDQRFWRVAQDEHGEVCPANWTKGSRTIKPDPVASLEYFAAQANGADEVHGNGETANGVTDGASKKRARVN
jgi:C-terminal domain of 1-Cys peroxiredoxin